MSVILDPAQIPVIAVDSMNRTHREEVEQINALGALLDTDPLDRDAIGQALDQWVAHTEAHFARENRLMEEHGFPPYPVHAQEHATVLAEIHALQRQWHQDGDPAPLRAYLFERWPQWFMMHVNSMDNITAQFLANFID